MALSIGISEGTITAATPTHGSSRTLTVRRSRKAATITDPIKGAPNGQTYVPDSLKVPPGWSRSWSTDGTTFQSSDTGTATTAVRATTPSARQGGTNLSADLLPPLQS